MIAGVKESGGFKAVALKQADEEWTDKWEKQFPSSPKRTELMSSLEVALRETPVPAQAFTDALDDMNPQEFLSSHAYTSTKDCVVPLDNAISGGLPDRLYPRKEVCGTCLTKTCILLFIFVNRCSCCLTAPRGSLSISPV